MDVPAQTGVSFSRIGGRGGEVFQVSSPSGGRALWTIAKPVLVFSYRDDGRPEGATFGKLCNSGMAKDVQAKHALRCHIGQTAYGQMMCCIQRRPPRYMTHEVVRREAPLPAGSILKRSPPVTMEPRSRMATDRQGSARRFVPWSVCSVTPHRSRRRPAMHSLVQVTHTADPVPQAISPPQAILARLETTIWLSPVCSIGRHRRAGQAAPNGQTIRSSWHGTSMASERSDGE